MTKHKESLFFNFYRKLILEHPLASLIFVFILTLLAASQLPKFRLDASGESLTLENDKSIDYYRQVNEKYGSDDFLIITWQPKNGLISNESIEGLKKLTTELQEIETVSNVNSILNVPLLGNVTLDTDALGEEIPTLTSPSTDREEALEEFSTSPLYKNLLVGEDGDTSAIQINFERDQKYFALLDARDELRAKAKTESLTSAEKVELSRLEKQFDAYSKQASERTSAIIEDVRTIMQDYRDIATMHLGGISMITNDMLTFIQHDITVFGVGILLFIMLALFVFFGKIRWVLLPLTSCVVTVIMLAGLLSFLDWRITVISSNFPAILLIVILALNVHLAVYYRDYISANPDSEQELRISTTLKTMFWPCFYTALTTIVAFISLLISGIRPVIDFGWIMTIGIVLGFITTFIIFPSFIQLLKKDSHTSGSSITYKITNWIYSFTVNYKALIFLVTIAIIGFSAYGITQLKVENRFIDYFKPSTEIYQGMTVIDKKLGGTTPLDIVIDKGDEASLVADDEFEDEFGDEFDSGIYDPGYWFTGARLKQVERIHDYIDLSLIHI